MNMFNELTSNLVEGRILAGESCFFSNYCKEKKTICNGQGCPVADGKTTKEDFSCGLARMVEVICKSQR